MNPSYNKFKADHLPFTWDVVNKHTLDNIEGLDTEQPISPDEWLERISKLKPKGKTVSADELKNI